MKKKSKKYFFMCEIGLIFDFESGNKTAITKHKKQKL